MCQLTQNWHKCSVFVRPPIGIVGKIDSLGWMVHAAKNLSDGKTPDGFGIKADDGYLTLNPEPLGPQHDEREPGWFPRALQVGRGPARSLSAAEDCHRASVE
jgi:hypothetical protein